MIQKVLTFRAASIGDCLMGKYLLENVHAQFPEAQVGIVIGSRGEMIRDLFAAYPWLEVIEVNRKSPRALWRLWQRWHGSDLVVTQYAGKKGGKFSFASKLAARLLARRGGMLGFTDASRYNSLLYDELVPFDPTMAPAELERRALAALAVDVSLPFPTLAGTPQPNVLSRFNLERGGYVLTHLFSGGNTRGLSPEKKEALVAALVSQVPADIKIILTGTAAEKEQALAAAAGTRAEVLAEKTSLQEMLALVKDSRAVVAVDTGVAHMAAQEGTPLIVLTSCLGAQWWEERQYSPQAPITVFINRAACGEEHAMVDYPPCLNDIDMRKVAARANYLVAE